MMQMVHSRFNALLSACVLSLIATASWSQSITWLGTLGGNESRAYGVSNNGVVVGWAYNAAGQPRAFRWTASEGMQDLGALGGVWSYATGVSADGSVVVGWAYNAAGRYRAFRWQNGVMQDLGTLPGYDTSFAYAVSADGRVVVGDSGWRAFRWQNGFMRDLGTLGGNESRAFGVSANGAVVVGMYYNAAGQPRAFRWTASEGMQDLGTLGGVWSYATGVSANGSVVVGWAHNAAGYLLAFRWQNGVMQDLGTLPSGQANEACGVSADGAVVVGFSYSNYRQRAIRWTESGGMEDLNTTYASLLTDGSVLYEARAISPNGRYIVGWGWNADTGFDEAFLLDTQGTPPCTLNGDVNGDGRVDDADLLIVLFNFGNRCR